MCQRAKRREETQEVWRSHGSVLTCLCLDWPSQTGPSGHWGPHHPHPGSSGAWWASSFLWSLLCHLNSFKNTGCHFMLVSALRSLWGRHRHHIYLCSLYHHFTPQFVQMLHKLTWNLVWWSWYMNTVRPPDRAACPLRLQNSRALKSPCFTVAPVTQQLLV